MLSSKDPSLLSSAGFGIGEVSEGYRIDQNASGGDFHWNSEENFMIKKKLDMSCDSISLWMQTCWP